MSVKLLIAAAFTFEGLTDEVPLQTTLMQLLVELSLFLVVGQVRDLFVICRLLHNLNKIYVFNFFNNCLPLRQQMTLYEQFKEHIESKYI